MELTTVVLAGLLLGSLTGAGFLIVDSEAIDTEAAAPPPIGSTTRKRAMPWRPQKTCSLIATPPPHHAARGMRLAWVIVLLGVVSLTACGGGSNGEATSTPQGANLTSRRDDVILQATRGSRQTVPHNKQRRVGQGDTVDVAGPGEGHLDFADGFVVRVFRDSELKVEGFSDRMSPFNRVRLNGGTLYAEISGEAKLAGSG